MRLRHRPRPLLRLRRHKPAAGPCSLGWHNPRLPGHRRLPLGPVPGGLHHQPGDDHPGQHHQVRHGAALPRRHRLQGRAQHGGSQASH